MVSQKKNLGIVGLGFVGSAIYEGLKNCHHIFTFDIEKDSNCQSLDELVNNVDYIFVCLPTPMKEQGECDLTIIESVIADISEIVAKFDSKKIVIIKSTVPVGFTERNNKKYNNLDFIFNPEFLTEANYIQDFKNQEFIILAGEKETCFDLKEIYYRSFPDCKYFITDYSSAEMIKYTVNNFLAIKVSFANEIYSFCDSFGIDYKSMIKIAMSDNRIGNSHWSVPGPDGQYGFGGSCFPKDTASLMHQFKSLDVESYIIKSAINRNLNLDRSKRNKSVNNLKK